ncbi:MAG TPA: hypothetical protein PK908_03795 [Bacteroidales bacterium]|jgi:hypothetical protein|nr:hypothetical protein [Bacteroidales bacterium]
METSFILTKSPKSIGVAILLTFLFGPVGLLYASVQGGLIMIFTPVFLLILIFAGLFQENLNLIFLSTGLLAFFFITYWLINIIWAVVSVKKYNKKIEDESKRQYELWDILHKRDHPQIVMKISQKPSEKNTSEQGINVSAKPSLREWLRNNPGRSVNDYYSKFGI